MHMCLRIIWSCNQPKGLILFACILHQATSPCNDQPTRACSPNQSQAACHCNGVGSHRVLDLHLLDVHLLCIDSTFTDAMMMHIMCDLDLSMTSLQSGNTLQHRLVILAQGHANVLCVFQELRANHDVARTRSRALIATGDLRHGRSCPRGPGPRSLSPRSRLEPNTAALDRCLATSCAGGPLLYRRGHPARHMTLR